MSSHHDHHGRDRLYADRPHRMQARRLPGRGRCLRSGVARGGRDKASTVSAASLTARECYTVSAAAKLPDDTASTSAVSRRHATRARVCVFFGRFVRTGGGRRLTFPSDARGVGQHKPSCTGSGTSTDARRHHRLVVSLLCLLSLSQGTSYVRDTCYRWLDSLSRTCPSGGGRRYCPRADLTRSPLSAIRTMMVRTVPGRWSIDRCSKRSLTCAGATASPISIVATMSC